MEKLIDCNKKALTKINRTNLWDIPSTYHFSIISFCFTSRERINFIKSIGISNIDICQLKLINSILHLSYRKTPQSEVLQKLLDNKFKLSLQNLLAITDEKILHEKWSHSITHGDLRGIYWAIMSHGLTNCSLRKKIYKEIAIQSYGSSCELLQLRRRNRYLEQEISARQLNLDQLQQELRTKTCKY